MKEIVGKDIWDFWEERKWVVVTTNFSVAKTGRAVMGKGIAKEAAKKFPSLSRELGILIKQDCRRVVFFPEYRVIIFPVKYVWHGKADLFLIEKSAIELNDALNKVIALKREEIFSVRPGCGNGGLDWSSVRRVVESYFDGITIVERTNGWNFED